MQAVGPLRIAHIIIVHVCNNIYYSITSIHLNAIAMYCKCHFKMGLLVVPCGPEIAIKSLKQVIAYLVITNWRYMYNCYTLLHSFSIILVSVYIYIILPGLFGPN